MNVERDALCAALVQEYSDVVARRGLWALAAQENMTLARVQADGAQRALERVAARLGITDLHVQATDVVARGQEEGREP